MYTALGVAYTIKLFAASHGESVLFFPHSAPLHTLLHSTVMACQRRAGSSAGNLRERGKANASQKSHSSN